MHRTLRSRKERTAGRDPRKILPALGVAFIMAFAVFLTVALAPSAAAIHETLEEEEEQPEEQGQQDDEKEPEIDEVDPLAGPAGTEVTVEGSGFTEQVRVYFGGYNVPFERFDDERLTFEVPDLAEEEYNIEVYNEEGDTDFCCFEITDGTPASSDPDEPDDVGSATSDDSDCREKGKNVQCSEFGVIKMESQRTIRGEPIDTTVEIFLNDNYADQDARSVLFSVRNVTDDGSNPIAIEVLDFSTPDGEILTTRIDEKGTYEINLWVDVLDLPVDTPITLSLRVGSSERGAYQLETLVMPFDRGYEPMTDGYGQQISIFSYTLLGINDETSGFGDKGPLTRLNNVPGIGVGVAIAALAGLGIALRRRTR